MLLNLTHHHLCHCFKSNEPQKYLQMKNLAPFQPTYILLILHISKLSHYTHPIPNLKRKKNQLRDQAAKQTADPFKNFNKQNF